MEQPHGTLRTGDNFDEWDGAILLSLGGSSDSFQVQDCITTRGRGLVLLSMDHDRRTLRSENREVKYTGNSSDATSDCLYVDCALVSRRSRVFSSLM